MPTLQLGCGEWGFRALPMEEHCRIARDFGFHTLEIGIGGDYAGRLPRAMDEYSVREFHALVSEYNLQAPFCCLENDFTLTDSDAHGAMLLQTKDEIRLAKRLGATHVRLFAGFTPASQMTEVLWRQLLDALEECASLGAELELKIAIETHGRITMINGAAHHEHTVSTEPESLRRLMTEMPPEIGFNYDPGNLKAVAPEDKTFVLPLLNERINYCHLKDWRRRGEGYEAVAMGDDYLDYGVLLPQMKFDGIYLIEYEPTEDVEAGIARSLEYLRRIGLPFALA
jgi:sugar phosphate isomerase/epimerase